VKKNLTITVAMASAIMALGACRAAPPQQAINSDAVCTNKATKARVPDSNCATAQNNSGGSNAGSNAFLWYYLGRSSAVPPVGQSVIGSSYRGSYVPDPAIDYRTAPPNPAPSYRSGLTSTTSLRSGSVPSRSSFSPTTIRTSTAVSRGGFGASAHAFGGHGGVAS
jgi:uncharacterized protein YgiB involved in biofilm formation